MERLKQLLNVKELSKSFKHNNKELNEKIIDKKEEEEEEDDIELDSDCTESINNGVVECKYTSVLLLLVGGVYMSSKIYKNLYKKVD